MPSMKLTAAFLAAVCLAASTLAAPAGTASAPQSSSTAPYASENSNQILWSENQNVAPQPIRGNLGATLLGPQNLATDLQNADLLAPPSTDSGTVGNAKWPFSLSHNRLQTGGWARQQNIKVMPLSTEMAGVNMRLEAGALRELHWHKTAEWAYVLKGNISVATVNSAGENYFDTVGPGDLWYFPPGVPHVLQATNDLPEGSEFLLVFDDGGFSEDSTFSLTDWLNHVPKSVLAKNFRTTESAFDKIPGKELYIFPAGMIKKYNEYILGYKAPVGPAGTSKMPYTFHSSELEATNLAGGSAKIIDSTTFNISKTISFAEVTVEPGHIRELHWHPSQDEWSYFLEGTGRVTLFASSANARTFNFQPGDIGYVPASYGHYVENTGNTTLRFLEVFKSDKFEDISLNQWLALTPPELVKDHLQLDDATIALLNSTKVTVI
ncbi:oxalate decarboxylase [Irpex rosettiformis]|uniref:Oxalate decarboxylase n=1 Tax=Irpex rosettiformis TaxID=378272 RepID=A0ACB8UAR3_9APHY|nr:oxalate decarboxylase [Irpex rosettiformis]